MVNIAKLIFALKIIIIMVLFLKCKIFEQCVSVVMGLNFIIAVFLVSSAYTEREHLFTYMIAKDNSAKIHFERRC